MLDEAPPLKRVLAEPQRRRFTVAEVWAMIEHGIIDPDEKFELIDGDFLPMSPKNHRHERTKHILNRALGRVIDDSLFVGIETTIYLDEWTFVEPDLVVVPERLRTEEVTGPDILVAIEIADTSLRRDRDLKAPRYAQAGVPLFWLIDVNARRITIHERPVDGVWTLIRVAGEADVLTVPALPGFSFRLADAD
jgi:Uma2 family endonuclease